MMQIAETYDHEMAKVYIVTTVIALIFTLGMGGIIFFFVGLTAFAILQSIGTMLMALLLGKTLLHLYQKNIRRKIKQKLDSAQMTEDDFVQFLSKQSPPFEFLNALYLSSKDLICQKS